jgi:catechol 2,3-dioxygenase-like lactoylglutathione lyase family enzyme
MPRAVGINHVALEVGDLDEALAFYGRIFELSLRGRHGSSMAFVDLGDQFIALSAGRGQPPDGPRHFGLVVDDRETALASAREAGAELLGDNDFRDPWGNHVQVVDYRDVQFSKTERILDGMGLAGLGKSERALRELREKGLAD